ncbi:MAG: 4Fe-4S binding protein [Bacteroidetes Order II. Incertae sedis bacterium]|nr:4Fe-4S binding protein [Bacteroidetes Order II. bacterium]
MTANPSYAFSRPIGLGILLTGLLICLIAALGYGPKGPIFSLIAGIGGTTFGSIWYIWATYQHTWPGIKNNYVMQNTFTARGVGGWFLGFLLTGFYVLLYWFPEYLKNMVAITEPLSQWMRGVPADQWFLYGLFYTLAVLVMGVRMLYKYRHNRYQIFRTLSVMFFQTMFAFIVPAVLKLMNEPEFYFHYFWPLDYDYLFPSTVQWLSNGASVAFFALIVGIVMTFVVTPLLTYFFGKRWYCSWVCGCGGLAETLGDPFRQLSDKSLGAWKVERWMIHTVLLLIVVLTALLWLNSWQQGAFLGTFSQSYAKWYGFWIGSVFSGVIGVGFYPIMGSRVWCRFGCPMAALMGLQQKWFSRFRITTNGGQCISCGNCSTYCEMGIDVRWYAQRGQNIVRASCVGCGVCAAVCPRGVLKLENGAPDRNERFGKTVIIPADNVDILT